MTKASPVQESPETGSSKTVQLSRWMNHLVAGRRKTTTAEHVASTISIAAPPSLVWRNLLFFEEVAEQPAWWLRLCLPTPIRTTGAKSAVGDTAHCQYDGGYLIKRIIRVEATERVDFEILEQDLSLDHWITLRRGSYLLAPEAEGTQVTVVTHYEGHQRPRWLCRRLEKWMAHSLHLHVLNGMANAVSPSARTKPTDSAAHPRAVG